MSVVATLAASRSSARAVQNFELFVVGTRVVELSGPAMAVRHAAHAVARCTARGADKQSGRTVSVRRQVAIADNGFVDDEQGGGRG